MSLLDTLIYGYRTIYAAGVEVTRRNMLNFVGATAVDNPTTGMTDVTIAAGGAPSMATVTVPMRSAAAATALVASTDYHLTMTAADVVTLPTAPAAGTSFEVKDIVGGSTLTPGGADTVEGGAGYIMVAGEAVVARYNATSTNWELC